MSLGNSFFAQAACVFFFIMECPVFLAEAACAFISQNVSGPSGVRFFDHMQKAWRLKVVAQNNVFPVCGVHFHNMSLPESRMYKSVGFEACRLKICFSLERRALFHRRATTLNNCTKSNFQKL